MLAANDSGHREVPVHHASRRRTATARRRPPLLRRVVMLVLAGALFAGALGGVSSVVGTGVAEAAGKGPGVSNIPGIGWIGAYRHNGRIVYCSERGVADPWADLPSNTTVSSLPAYRSPSGIKASKMSSKSKMRQLNYLLDTYAQTSKGSQAAGLATAIWILRADNKISSLKSTLRGSAKGRAILNDANAMLAAAKRNAVAPVAPKKVTGKLALTINSARTQGTVSWPAGATSITLTKAKFTSSGKRSVTVTSGKAGSRGFTLDAPKPKKQTVITAKAKWKTTGTRGWEPKIKTWKASNVPQQRVVGTTGSSTVKTLGGTLGASATVTAATPSTWSVSSQAQASADVGGTMTDTAIVTGAASALPQPGYIDFVAYLQPLAGATKHDSSWNPILGDPYDVEEPVLDADGLPTYQLEVDADGNPVFDADGNPVPVLDDDGNPVPATETVARQDPVTWTEEELAGLSAAELCVLQPVATTARQRVTAAGRYTSEPVEVKSAGTVYWTERYWRSSTNLHTGRCGLANEKTAISTPGVVTQATETAVIGDEISDTATVTGRFAAGAEYHLVFEAYRAPAQTISHDDEDDPAAAEPTCETGNLIYRSGEVPVTGPGEVESGSLPVRYAHGTTIWWVESLYLTPEGGDPQLVHRGECGLENETTTVSHPEVETRAVEDAVVGDHLFDTAIVSGELARNDHARWEVTFEAFQGVFEERASTPEELEETGEATQQVPVCETGNRLFETGATEVTGPGEVESERVVATTAHVGTIWWIETLWVIEGGERTEVHRGECGLENETTEATGPTVTTQAVEVAFYGDELYDTAIVEGELSAREGVTHEVTFSAYRAEYGGGAPVCEPGNLLFTTEATAVTGPGTYESSRTIATPEHAGTIWWIETLWQIGADGGGGDEGAELHRAELARGECGLENETTNVPEPKVTTTAVSSAIVGEEIWDVADVEGPLSTRDGVSHDVIFEAYLQPADSPDPVCEAGNRIFVSDTVRVTKPGEYTSEKFTTETAHVGTIYWVESLRLKVDGEETVIHRGECGAKNEITRVSERLPVTGSAPLSPGGLLGVAGLVLAAGAAALAWVARRRRTGLSVESTDSTE
ncbi:hypothetical protein J4H92_04225 [Leucobacter weissii]|uniref:Uncharacterized protein n=1 Tax=Leucobacter weissii TaxID=1983706 RepID=A0A939MHS1_9MICO|nr:hypothetical protein [Leucobacter weissii]MBO1901154.1 hypothetical protein [Leucobacter weissii]